MNIYWLALISTLYIVSVKSDIFSAYPQQVKKDPSYYHDSDLFELDTLAGLGLGKRSSDFIPHSESQELDDGRFAFYKMLIDQDPSMRSDEKRPINIQANGPNRMVKFRSLPQGNQQFMPTN